MKKNIFIKLLSAAVIISVLLGVTGCSVGNGKKVETGNDDVGVVDFEKLDDGSGTVVYTHKNKNEDTGKVETYTENVSLEEVDTAIGMNSAPFDDDKSKDAFISQDGMGDYGMDKNTAEKIAKDPTEWKTFYFVKYVENKSDKTMVTKSVKAVNNGEGGLYIRTLLDSETGIGPGGCTSITFYGVADMSNFETDEELDAALEKVQIQLIYTLTDDKYGDIDNWDEVTTQVAHIN